jgi:hypothetical protein
MEEATSSLDSAGGLCSRDAVFRDFHLCDAAKREKQLDEIFRGIFGSLAENVADGRGYGSVEQYVTGLQSGEIHAHCLARLKGSHISPLVKLCPSCAAIANRVVWVL